jgi:hypothetical protein
MHPTLPLLKLTDFPAIRRKTLDTFAVAFRCTVA